MADVIESVTSGARLTWPPLVSIGACPRCDDAKQFAVASSRLWEIGAGHTRAHHRRGVWEIFRYGSLWPRAAENTLQGLAFTVVLRDHCNRRPKKKTNKQTKHTEEKNIPRAICFNAYLMSGYLSLPLGDPSVDDQEYSVRSNSWKRRSGPWCHTEVVRCNDLWLLASPEILWGRGDFFFTFAVPVTSPALTA